MNREQYLKEFNALLDQANALLDEGDMEGAAAKQMEAEALKSQYEKEAQARAKINALKDSQPIAPKAMNMLTQGKETPINNTTPQPEEDIFNSIEYRKAFMNYCQTGKISKEFMNADELTDVTEAAAVIPTTIMQEIIKKMESYGIIFNRVRKTNIQGGVEVPILSLKPTASWITETSPSEKKKVTANTKVTFTYHGLECKVATSLIANIVSLEMFEREIVALIVEAMIKAMDLAVIKGTGSGQPLGITVDSRVPSANIITLASKDFNTWEGWKKNVFAKIPLAYRSGGSFIMAAGTFEGYIDGMVDANGQPIGRINYGTDKGPQERFGGREVILVEDDVITPYDSASTAEIVAVFCKLGDYCINSNMQMTMIRYNDHDLNQVIDKAILVADGKILDPNGVIIIKKGA